MDLSLGSKREKRRRAKGWEYLSKFNNKK